MELNGGVEHKTFNRDRNCVRDLLTIKKCNVVLAHHDIESNALIMLIEPSASQVTGY